MRIYHYGNPVDIGRLNPEVQTDEECYHHGNPVELRRVNRCHDRDILSHDLLLSLCVAVMEVM